MIYNQDCMEAMKEMSDNQFDLAIVDPPYGIGADVAQNKAAERRKRAKGKNKSGRGWKEYKKTNWDNAIPTDEFFIELLRVSKKQIIWGGNYFPYLWQFSNSFIIWNKEQREFSLADGELAWYSKTNKAMRIFDFSRGGALANNKNNGGRLHPTQKPVALAQRAIINSTKEGNYVLDLFGGSGSTLIACQKNIRKSCTMELDTKYCDVIVKRWQNFTGKDAVLESTGELYNSLK